MKKYIKAKKIVLENEVLEEAYLEIRDEKFGQVVMEKPVEGEVIDYSDWILSPGLVDTHIHGFHSHDVMDNDVEGLKEISKGLLSCGVTSWLATTFTDTTENLNEVCKTIGDHYQEMPGAKIRGIFLEGPFFTEKHKGAQNPNYMSNPNKEKLDRWHKLSHDLVNKIALAPEREGVEDFIKFATKKGVYTALGHSDASFEQAKAAVDAGANIFVHTYNGMSGLHHRNPGMVGAALTLEDVYAEIITDGHHVHPAAIDVVLKARGKDETVFVTDCMGAGGIGEGMSKLGEFDVEVKDGQARLVSDGSLAGSVLELIQGVQNVVEWKLASLEEALQMASLTPAKSVGIDHLCGKISSGFDADFILVDEKGNLQATYLNGEKVYEREI